MSSKTETCYGKSFEIGVESKIGNTNNENILIRDFFDQFWYHKFNQLLEFINRTWKCASSTNHKNMTFLMPIFDPNSFCNATTHVCKFKQTTAEFTITIINYTQKIQLQIFSWASYSTITTMNNVKEVSHDETRAVGAHVFFIVRNPAKTETTKQAIISNEMMTMLPRRTSTNLRILV